MEKYVKVPVKFFHIKCDGEGEYVCVELECKCDGFERESLEAWGSTEEEAFANLLAKLGYEEATTPTMSDKMRDVARWFDQLVNADCQTDSISGELYAWARSIEVCEGKQEAK